MSHQRVQLTVPQQRTPPVEPVVPSAPPPSRPRRHTTRLAYVVPLTLGAFGVCAAAGAGIGLLTTPHARTTHSFTLASSVAGMTRDPAQESAYAAQVSGVRDGFEQEFGGRLAQFVTGVYDSPRSAGGPAGSVVFVGAAFASTGDPGDFVSTFRAQAAATGAKVTSVDVGDGALAACSRSAASPAVTTCAWSTGDSVGQLVPTVDGWGSRRLGAVLREFRAVVEVSSTNR